jgi:chaperonin GroEL
MAKKILFNEEAKKALKVGIDTVAHAVCITIGPRGQNVVYDKGYGVPVITNDGVSIAKEIILPDAIENMGAEIIKEVAIKTNEIAGDGTTTSVILAHAMITEGMKQVSMGANGILVRQGIEKATEQVVIELKKLAKPIKTDKDIRNIATISAESDELGITIADIIKKVGNDGVVTVEESQSFGVTSSVAVGISFEKGYVSPHMVTNTERMEAEMKDPYILITDKKITSIKEVLPLIEKVIATGKKEMVIIADDIEGDALTTFVVNKLRGTFSVLAVQAPGYADRKRDQLVDIAIMTGGSVLTDEVGLGFENVELEHLGHASRVVSKKDSTLIVSGRGNKKMIEQRIQEIRRSLVTAQKFDREALQKRLAKFTGGIGVIHVGATTEGEMKYLKLKIEDAVNATKAAIGEGIVFGGGIALIRAGEMVAKQMKNIKMKNKEFEVGFTIVLGALSAPLRQIVENSGNKDGSIVIEKIKDSSKHFGYDAYRQEYVNDMCTAGIIDPVKVTRTALQNASSAAGVFLTTEVAIAPIPEKVKEE